MADTEGKKKRDDIWGSVEGVVQKDSLVKDDKGVAAVVLGNNGASLKIKGYGEKFSAMVEAAADSGQPVIFRGHILGSGKNNSVHLSIKTEGPAELKGEISHVRRSGEGKQPYVNFFLLNEVTSKDGKEWKIGTGVSVYGDEAVKLDALKDGDRVSLQGRETKDGYRATSGVAVIPAPAPEVEDEVPSM